MGYRFDAALVLPTPHSLHKRQHKLATARHAVCQFPLCPAPSARQPSLHYQSLHPALTPASKAASPTTFPLAGLFAPPDNCHVSSRRCERMIRFEWTRRQDGAANAGAKGWTRDIPTVHA